MKFILTFCILSLSLNGALGQDLGQVRFLVDVDNGYFEIVINDTLYLKKYKDSLPAGKYSAEIWSPGYVLETKEFEVVSGQNTDVEITLVHNNDFANYEYEYQEYRNDFHKSLTLPLSLTLASGLYTGGVMMRMFNFRQLTKSELTLYDLSVSTTEIAEIKTNINAYDKKFRRNRAFFYSGSIVTGLLAVFTTYSYMKFKRNSTEPTYIKDSPFKDRFSLLPNPTGVTLRLKLG